MKKSLSLLLILAMVFAMAGCGQEDTVGNEEANKSNDATDSNDSSSEDTGADTSDSDTEEATSAEDTIVGFIYVGPVGDGGFTYSHDLGRQALEEELGVKTIYKENVPETQEVESEVRNMIDQGASIIFATSFGYMEYIKNIASEYPDVEFFHCSGYEMSDNMSNYFGRMYQARYLTGIAAALKTETNKVGYVGAFPIPEVIRGINAFTLGAKSVNPDIEVDVVWTSTWYDPAAEKSAAQALIDQGADIISQHQDTAGPQQAAEEAGVYSIGYHTDMEAMAPNAVLTSAIWDWSDYYVSRVQAIMDGTFEAESYWGSMADGVVGLAPLSANAAEGTQEAIDEAKAAILDGSLHVFGGEIVDNNGDVHGAEGSVLSDEDMLSMDWFVEGVNASVE